MSYFPRCPSAETPEPPKSDDDDDEAEEGESASGMILVFLKLSEHLDIRPRSFPILSARDGAVHPHPADFTHLSPMQDSCRWPWYLPQLLTRFECVHCRGQVRETLQIRIPRGFGWSIARDTGASWRSFTTST